MHRRTRLIAAFAAAISSLGTLTMVSPATATLPDVTVTVIDSGVRVTHQEFDYVSQTDTTDQVVAWWDFSNDASPPSHRPGPSDLWDTTTNSGEPWDGTGHGSAVASAAVGLNVAGPATKRPSLCPGCKLAVAKVSSVDDAVAAFKWARETIHTNVISMSLGSLVPIPSQIVASLYREIRLARQAGILVVLSNGNTPAPGFASAYANSPYALGVGASSSTRGSISSASITATADPEVTSDFANVPLASRSCDTCYAPVSGTSFSAPIVAGFAARLIQENPAMSPDYFEKLIKYSAYDSLVPVVFEGYGVIDGAPSQLSSAIAHAAAGTLPPRPAGDFDGMYVEQVQGVLDQVWTGTASEGSQLMVDMGLGTPSPAGTIGLSAPTAVSDAEVYKLTANRGDVVTVDLDYATADLVNDLDLYVIRVNPAFPPETMPSGNEMVTYSATLGAGDEGVSFVAPSTGEYFVVALGHLVVLPQAFTITSNKTVSLWRQGYMAHTFATGNPYLVEAVWNIPLPSACDFIDCDSLP